MPHVESAHSDLIVAIDGPSGSGKSSTSRGVAKALGLRYLDTGAMYRAIAVAYRDRGLRPGQGDETAAMAADLDLRISTDPDDFWISIDGRDITHDIRQPEVSAMVSQVAVMLPVRDVLHEQQRRIIAAGGIVAEGRDVTTVVAPDADLRILLVADPQARLRRRQLELSQDVSVADVADQVLRRDKDDSTVSSFTQAADGVYTLDSTYLTLAEVIDRICAMAKEITKE